MMHELFLEANIEDKLFLGHPSQLGHGILLLVHSQRP